MTPPTAPERCPTCDREGLNCPTLETLVRGTLPNTEVRRIAIEAMQDCHAHRVDWRARAIAAEKSVDELECELGLLRADIDEHLPAYDIAAAGDDPEPANPREVVEYAGDELRRANKAAAQWAKVAPLIERLRGASTTPTIELLGRIADLLAATEATP